MKTASGFTIEKVHVASRNSPDDAAICISNKAGIVLNIWIVPLAKLAKAASIVVSDAEVGHVVLVQDDESGSYITFSVRDNCLFFDVNQDSTGCQAFVEIPITQKERKKVAKELGLGE